MVFVISACASPFLGFMVDKVGKNVLWGKITHYDQMLLIDYQFTIQAHQMYMTGELILLKWLLINVGFYQLIILT